MTAPRYFLYWEWVEHESALIHTDGCSKVTGAFRKHCRVHDLAYYYARDLVDAYRRFVAGDPAYWVNARLITKAEADAQLRRGMQSDSPAGFFSPLAVIRWLGLEVAGGKAWDAHRARDGNGVTCPHCGEDRLVEVIGRTAVCWVCGKSWPAAASSSLGAASTPDAGRVSQPRPHGP